MFDLRPVGFVIGQLFAALGVSMLIPMATDILYQNGHWHVFLESAIITVLMGGMVALASANRSHQGLNIQQTFLLTVGVWVVLPIAGAVPFILGATEARVVDAYFEAMSGMTTTGSTVFSRLENLPRGILLWRSMMQWFGGVGIVVTAMVFMPELKVGGMQIFRTESFETEGKILPRAVQIAQRISVVYLLLTTACFVAFLMAGMNGFQSLNHALTVLSTGGMSTSDASFGAFQGAPEYIASVFMLLASLPFVRYVQLLGGNLGTFGRDTQVRGFAWVAAISFAIVIIYRMLNEGEAFEPAFREGIFNVTSVLTGTGFASVDYQLWGPFLVVLFFFMGLIGGCAGSTCCSIKIFRFQILFSAIKAQIRSIHTPHGMFRTEYNGRPISPDILSSVTAFFLFFIFSLGLLSVLLGLTGLDFITSVSGAATAVANIGPGLGDIIGPAGNFSPLNDTAKWLLCVGMLLGRLEMLTVFALLSPYFWKD